MTLRINVDKKKSIYLDERGVRNPHANPKAKGYLGYFFIGGIEIYDRDKDKLVKFVQDAKSQLYPDKDSSDWELKGASNPTFVKDETLTDQENNVKQIEAAKEKWTLWSKALQKTPLEYKLYGSFVKLDDFKKQKPESTENDVIKAAFINVAYKFVNFGCIQRDFERDVGVSYTLFPSSFYFDNVANLQEESVLEAFQEYPDHYPHIADGLCVGQNLNFITNDDYNAQDELIMQFVDMQIYALTRFLYPGRGNDGNEQNILINFEEFVTKLPLIQKQLLILSNDELRAMEKLHHDIVPIFHHIQNRFHRYGWKDGRPATSLALIADDIYENFGMEAHQLMQEFGGMNQLPNGELFNKLNREPTI